MASQISLLFLFSLLLSSSSSLSSAFSFSVYNRTAIDLSVFGFNSVAAAASSDCNGNLAAAVDEKEKKKKKPNLKLHLNHRPLHHHPKSTKADSLLLAAHKDHTRIVQTLSRKVINKTDVSSSSSASSASRAGNHSDLVGRVVATINSGVPLGSGEYFINAFIGTPPKHFQLILDTGSDLNWIQCLPCHDCFDQHGPVFDPSASSSYRNVPCPDPRCALVASPEPAPACAGGREQPCPYFYWYGDRSNTTGDLALETFTVNLTSPDGRSAESHRVDDVIFGCGHWNRGLFHGASGLLGLGRGPLSFASQLKTAYGHTFSYCLVDRNSDLSVSSKLIFGEDESLANHPNLNYTSFVGGKESAADTFYYVQVKGIRVGGEMVQVAAETWELSEDGAGGTIVDSGTTLSYLADPAYEAVRKAFVERVKYPLVADFPVLSPCYNVSGAEKAEMPGFSIVFGDGAVWDFPTENYFIRLEPEGIMCLAILGTPTSSLSIIGNYQQQNFHVLYDAERSRLGFAPMRCAEI